MTESFSGILSEKTADELFAIDTTGSEQIKNDYVKKHKPLKADEIIAARDSSIPALEQRKRKIADVAPAPGGKRSKSGNYVSHKELQRLKNIAYNAEQHQKHAAPTKSADYDPWAVEPAPQDPRFSFLEEKKPKVEPVTIKHAPISLAASGKPFKAVSKPEAGKSYNPAFEDWQAILTREGEKEVAAERQRLHAAREEAEKLEKALAEAAKPDPVSDEEYESAWESEWEGIQSGGEEAAAAWLTKKRPERKTPAERNKIKRRKELERQEKWNKQMKKRDEQQARIRQIAAELKKKEEDARKAQVAIAGEESSDEERQEEKLRRRKFGKNPIPEAPLEVVLADELQDSLRALKPEGNLLKDRYRNLLLNGKVEARRQAVHKKPRRERTEKWSYKDWKLR